ncbi:hypothetical protein OOK36_49810 [Streptomyces sp. NBC_00365]|uniref:hypothetical protein n=1 Tax=Streptomyces sp. NBC_00365 TaxID=2975726 RepID=UPI00225B4120|nr:hypothetical protein [Streptomyces sp. NBC_00365]MCX5096677.1 hypothetical protein [Streptomyces sp. NBC_00365]
MLVAASLQDSSASTARGVVTLALFVVGLMVMVSGFIIGEDSADGDRAWLVWLWCGLLMIGAAIALVSLVVAFWYVVVCAGGALILAVLRGLVMVMEPAFERAGDSPLPYGLSGVGVGVICLAGAVVSAVKGHPWLALIALAAAMALIGTAAGVILQEGRFELTPGQATIVFIVGMLATLPGGLALLVLGPLVALTTSGDAFDRVINGGIIAGFGGSGIWASTQLPRLNRWYPRNSMK